MRRFYYVMLSTFLGLVVAACVLLALPPWQNRWACQFQVALYDWTGVESFHRLPFDDGTYTGTIRLWDKWGKLRLEETRVNGAFHGIQKEFGEDGLLERMREYKNGRPWNGVCNLREGRAFWVEYRDGKPYNGCLGPFEAPECYIDGSHVSVDEFVEHHSLNMQQREDLWGIDVFSQAQWRMQATQSVK